MSLSNVAAQSIHRNAYTVYKKIGKLVFIFAPCRADGAHTQMTHLTTLAFLFPSMASLAHNLRTEANVASEEKKNKNTQRWTGLSEWRGNRAVGLLLHSGTFSTTTTTTTTRHTGMTHVYAN